MTPKAQEVAVKRKKIMLFFGLVIILTLAFAIKKIYFKPSAIDKKVETLSFIMKTNCPILVNHDV
ncbi:hypothetical protein [Aquiflexum sp.]|uniref:hypothetical protein n=1 Tax=Aquiflexum sp. TaxID=1872584 RepID=UPI0035933A54